MIWQARKDEDLTYMFAYINGFLEDVTVDNAVIDVNGFGINVRISADTASRLPGIGEQVRLYTYTYVKEDAFLLYGFLSRSDLEMFKLCITVSGIGPKGALAILSVMDADSLRFAIMSGDAKAISKAPGVGTRTAQRLILELKAGHSPEEAIRQIREKQYALRFKGKPGEKERYTGQILGVGISYNKDTKEHHCKIEQL